MTNITHLERISNAVTLIVAARGISIPAAVMSLRQPDAWGHITEGALTTPVALVASAAREKLARG
jgi:hypothetical protein